MAKALVSIRDATMRNEAAIELQRVILAAQSDALAAQSDQFSLLDRIRDLETQITRLKTWDAEKKKYNLKDLGSGAFVYARKEGAKPTETPHWLCTNCYEDAKKSVLLRSDAGGGRVKLWICYQCKSHIELFFSVTTKFRLLTLVTIYLS